MRRDHPALTASGDGYGVDADCDDARWDAADAILEGASGGDAFGIRLEAPGDADGDG